MRGFVGQDALGNRYYEMPGPHATRTRRSVLPRDGVQRDVFEYSQEMLPVEWRAWLEHRRTVPPTDEEIEAAKIHQETVRSLAATRQERMDRMAAAFFESQPQPPAPPLPDPADESARRPAAAQIEEPTGQGESFRPGTWGAKRN